MTSDEFLLKIKKECEQKKVLLKLINKESIPYDRKKTFFINGYFVDCPKPILACAIKKPSNVWMPILIHESCHMDQWFENSEIWKKQYIDGVDISIMFDRWLTGKDYNKKTIDFFIETIQELELDCEMSSVFKIEKLKLPIDIKNYIQMANAYLFSYSIVKKIRIWPKKPISLEMKLINEMPTKLLSLKDYSKIDKDFIKLFKADCYSNNRI